MMNGLVCRGGSFPRRNLSAPGWFFLATPTRQRRHDTDEFHVSDSLPPPQVSSVDIGGLNKIIGGQIYFLFSPFREEGQTRKWEPPFCRQRPSSPTNHTRVPLYIHFLFLPANQTVCSIHVLLRRCFNSTDQVMVSSCTKRRNETMGRLPKHPKGTVFTTAIQVTFERKRRHWKSLKIRPHWGLCHWCDDPLSYATMRPFFLRFDPLDWFRFWCHSVPPNILCRRKSSLPSGRLSIEWTNCVGDITYSALSWYFLLSTTTKPMAIDSRADWPIARMRSLYRLLLIDSRPHHSIVSTASRSSAPRLWSISRNRSNAAALHQFEMQDARIEATPM